MGCDIHIYREKLVNNEWKTADTWTPFDYGDGDAGISVNYDDRAYTGRNYQLFGVLSNGVRCETEISIDPRGLPDNASDEVKKESEAWGCDGHSHSWLTIDELKELKEKSERSFLLIEGMKDRDKLEDLQKTIQSGSPDWDLLFPYCRWGNSSNLVPFSLEVPASFYIGGCLDKIIESLEYVGGDDQRIVFFFDN